MELLKSRPLLVLAVVVGAIGCTDGPVLPLGTGTRVVATSATVAQGAEVTVRLENPGFRDWGYNLCSDSTLERREGAAWVEAPPAFNICAAILYPLPAGSERTGTVYVPLGTPTGEHRVRVRFIRGSESMSVTSNSFAVQ